MSNVYINRNRAQGAYTAKHHNQQFLTTDQIWNKRAERSKQGQDLFYKTSLKYHANPDLADKHVGMQWSIVDASDAVKKNKAQAEHMMMRTQTEAPLYKAYNTYENPNLTYEQRLELYPGPGSPLQHPTMQSNGFSNYKNSGAVGPGTLRDQIRTITERINNAKREKGTLCLNNGRPNGDSWKQPMLDQALHSLAGTKGGETEQRFYMKFPIYRPRSKPPSVNDDIQKIWDNQLSQTFSSKPNFLTDTRTSSYVKYGRGRNESNFLSPMADSKGTLRYEKEANRCSSTVASPNEKVFKMTAQKNLVFPRRERFNEDTSDAIKQEQKSRVGVRTLNDRTLNSAPKVEDDIRSQVSKASSRFSHAKTMTKTELARYFAQKKEQIEEDKKSRISQVSKGTGTLGFKTKFLKRLEDRNEERAVEEGKLSKEPSLEKMDTVDEQPDESIKAREEEVNAQEKEEKEEEEEGELEDAQTVATSGLAADQISLAPTELLAREYHRLAGQLASEHEKRLRMEEELELLQQ